MVLLLCTTLCYLFVSVIFVLSDGDIGVTDLFLPHVYKPCASERKIERQTVILCVRVNIINIDSVKCTLH